MPPRRRPNAVVSAAPKTSVRTATKARAQPKAQPKPRAAARKTSTLSAMIGSDDDDEEEEEEGAEDEQQEQEQQSSADEQEEDEGEEDELSAAQVPAVKTTGRKRAAPAPAAPIAPAAKKGRRSAQPAEETEVAPKAAKGRAGSAAIPDIVIEKKREETDEEVLPKSRRGRKKKAEAVVEIAETQDVNMYDAGAEVVSKTPPQKPKDWFCLEEWRTNEAEARLAEFVKNSEDIQADSQRLIDALQADVEAQTALAAGSRTLTKKLAAKEAENAKLSAKIAELNKTIATAQKDNQMLQAKLTAAETSRVPVPGSAVKPGRGGVAVMAGSAGDQAWKAHVKEELYRDLTNLVIMGIKKEADTQVFECLQTGVNGTLHFRLHVRAPNPGRKSKPPGAGAAADDSDDKDDDEYIFMPILDEKRDQLVISLLPDYLRQEISFSKDHAARFFQKIHSILTKPPATEDEEETEEEEEEEEEGSQDEGGETIAAAATADETTMTDDE